MSNIHDSTSREELNRKHLIQFVSRSIAQEYLKYLEQRQEEEKEDDCEAKIYWTNRIKREVIRLEKVLNNLLDKEVRIKGDLKITSESVILKRAFKMVNIKEKPRFCLSPNIVYVIKK